MGKIVPEEAQQVTFIPSSFDDTNSVYESFSNINNALKGTGNTSSNANIYAKKGSGAETWAYFNFDCSSIPSKVLINSVTCQFQAYQSDNTNYITNCYAFVSIGTTALTPNTATVRNSTSIKTISPNNNFVRSDLDNIKFGLHCKRVTSSSTYYNSTSTRFNVYGSNLIVNYSPYHYEYDISVLNNVDGVTTTTGTTAVTEGNSHTISFTTTKSLNSLIIEDNNVDITSQFTQSGNTYSYTYSNVDDDHIITINPSVIDLEEDPQYTYHTLSVSAINALTNPLQGSKRIVDGTNEVVTIYPSEPQITLALDNGVDITSQLVPINQSTGTASVTQGSGATYYFPLDTSTGYYKNNNINNGGTYAISRITISANTTCLVTIYYKLSISGNADYFSIGNKNTTLSQVNNSTGCRIRTSATYSNFTSVTFDEVENGDYFDIRFFRANSTSSTSTRTCEFYVEVTPINPTSDYTYTITNMQDDHSLVFVFGQVVYYTIETSTSDTGFKMMPTGKWVCLPGDTYKLTLIPDSVSTNFELLDNNIDKSSYLITHNGIDENDNPIKNCIYKLFNVDANHNIEISTVVAGSTLYLKVNGSFVQMSKVYQKVNGSWVEVSDPASVLNPNKIYILRQ